MENNDLEKKFNFSNLPGSHTRLSPVVGIDLQAQSALDELSRGLPALKSFENAIYDSKNIYLIPSAKEKEAREISMQIFEAAIAEFKTHGLTTKNAVDWGKDSRTGVTHVYDLENEWNTWCMHAIVRESSHKDGKYLPVGLVAAHEIMHVRQTRKGISEEDYKDREKEFPVELAPGLMTIVLVDQVYKEVHNKKLESIVDHRNIQWDKHTISLGQVANFYRALLKREGSIYKAIQSKESLELIKTGKIPTIQKTGESEN